MGHPHRAPARRLAVDAVPVRRVGDPLGVQDHHLDAADQLLRLVHQLSLRTAQRLSSEHSGEAGESEHSPDPSAARESFREPDKTCGLILATWWWSLTLGCEIVRQRQGKSIRLVCRIVSFRRVVDTTRVAYDTEEDQPGQKSVH